MKHIAIIGHSRTMETVAVSIRDHFKNIETVNVEFIDADLKDAAIEYIKAQSDQLDGIVFTGRKPYELINAAMGIDIPQIYIHHDRSILLQTLMEASLKEDFDIRSVSCDAYSRDDLVDAYNGFGMATEGLDLYTAPRNIMGDNLVWELYAYHKENYDLGRVSFCMSGISMVYEKLQEAGIPSILMRPTTESVIHSIRQLLIQMDAVEKTESQIVVVSMEIDLPNEYNLIHENEYQLMLEKTRVSEHVYKFAEIIQAAVVEVGSHNYLLFTTRQILEAATADLTTFPVLRNVQEGSTHTLSVGIGYGKTAREAKYNAARGLNKALNKGGNQAISVKEEKFSEPIFPQVLMDQNMSAIADPLYKSISTETGISINTIYKLQCIKEKLKKERFTSTELSEEFGNTRRSMNRIIEKLELAGYAFVDGKRMMSDTGRPTRIIRLKF